MQHGFIELTTACGEEVILRLMDIKDIRPCVPSAVSAASILSATTIECKDGRIYDIDVPISQLINQLRWKRVKLSLSK